MTLIARERPRGLVVRELRERAGMYGRIGRQALARRLHCTEQQVKDWETERRGVLMPASAWLLMRITLDPLARAQWLPSLQRKPREDDSPP